MRSRYEEKKRIMKNTDKKEELKPCPYRVHGERIMSLTIPGEYYYNEIFMPCMKEECVCFHRDGNDVYCDRNGAYVRLKR